MKFYFELVKKLKKFASNFLLYYLNSVNFLIVHFLLTKHVGKYDRADDRPKLAMLAANVGYIGIGRMIDRSLDDNCGRIIGFLYWPQYRSR